MSDNLDNLKSSLQRIIDHETSQMRKLNDRDDLSNKDMLRTQLANIAARKSITEKKIACEEKKQQQKKESQKVKHLDMGSEFQVQKKPKLDVEKSDNTDPQWILFNKPSGRFLSEAKKLSDEPWIGNPGVCKYTGATLCHCLMCCALAP